MQYIDLVLEYGVDNLLSLLLDISQSTINTYNVILSIHLIVLTGRICPNPNETTIGISITLLVRRKYTEFFLVFNFLQLDFCFNIIQSNKNKIFFLQYIYNLALGSLTLPI